MTEFELGDGTQHEADLQVFFSKLLHGFGLDPEQTSSAEIEGFSLETIGFPGRGMEDDMLPMTEVPVAERLYERVADVADALGETPEEFIAQAITDRLRRNAAAEQRIGRTGRTVPGTFYRNDMSTYELDS